MRRRVTDRSEQLVFAVRVEVDERHLGGRLGFNDAEVLVDEVGGVRCVVGEVLAPASASLGHVDAPQECGDHLAQLGEHHVGVRASFGQRVGTHAQEQRFVALSGAVDAHVAERRRWQHASHGVECLGTRRLAIDEVGVVGAARHGRTHVVGDLVDELAVRVEHAVHVADITGAQRARAHFRVSVVAVTPAEPRVVGDVASALLEVRHEPSPLQDFGEHIRGLLTGEVNATELGHGVVPVLDEDSFVQFFRARHTDRRVDRLVTRQIEVADELV